MQIAEDLRYDIVQELSVIQLAAAELLERVPVGDPRRGLVERIQAAALKASTAGTISCEFHDPAYASVSWSCSISGVTLFVQTAEPGFNLRPVEGTVLSPAGDSLHWELTQKPVGQINCLITANGLTKGGVF